MSDNLSTVQLSYRLLRDSVSSADTDLTATTKNWATFLSTYHPRSGSSGIAVELRPIENRLTVIFDFATANSDTAAASLYAYKEGGPAEFICSIATLTAGNQESDIVGGGSTTRYFCDTITAPTQRWPNTVGRADYEGDNGMAKLTFDARGYKYLLCLFTTIGSGSTRAWFSGH